MISITPPPEKQTEHRLLEHLHSTPLPAVVDAHVAPRQQQQPVNNNNNEEEDAASSGSSSCSSGRQPQTATASLAEGLKYVQLH